MEFKEQENYKDAIGIYAIKNLINNKVYIGYTAQNFQRRYWHHHWKLKNNSHDNQHLQAAWNKYGGENFIFEIIEVITGDINIQQLEDLEVYWIKYYSNKGLSYNIALGGGGKRGVPMSVEAKKIVGYKNKLHNLGKSASQETREKMSKSRTGKRIYKGNDTLTDDQIVFIKTELINGKTPSEISHTSNIPYKSINNIYSGNAYKTVHVDGWDDFYSNRKRAKRSPNFSKDEIMRILKLYNDGLNYSEIGRMFDTSRTRIRQCVIKNSKIS